MDADDSSTNSPPWQSLGTTAGFARRVLFVCFVAALLLLVWTLSDVLLLMFGAVIVATILRSFAAPLQSRLGVSPRLAVAVAILVAVLVIAVGAWLVGDRLIEQTENLRQQLPEAIAALTQWFGSRSFGAPVVELWEGAKAGELPWAKVANAATRTVGAIGTVGLAVIVGVYLALSPDMYRDGLVRLVPLTVRPRIRQALVASGHALSRWLLGQGISMLFVGSATAIGLAVLGMPLALSIGVIAGALAFIPFFGPIASGILATLIAFMEGPTQALYVAGLCVVIQQIEGNLLMPFVQRWAVELPPVLGIMAAVIFGLLFGLPGVVLATPLMVVVIVLVEKLYVEGVLESPADPSRSTKA